jgi:hypothetical protein
VRIAEGRKDKPRAEGDVHYIYSKMNEVTGRRAEIVDRDESDQGCVCAVRRSSKPLRVCPSINTALRSNDDAYPSCCIHGLDVPAIVERLEDAGKTIETRRATERTKLRTLFTTSTAFPTPRELSTDLQKELCATMQFAKVNQDDFSLRNVNVFYQDCE